MGPLHHQQNHSRLSRFHYHHPQSCYFRCHTSHDRRFHRLHPEIHYWRLHLHYCQGTPSYFEAAKSEANQEDHFQNVSVANLTPSNLYKPLETHKFALLVFLHEEVGDDDRNYFYQHVLGEKRFFRTTKALTAYT